MITVECKTREDLFRMLTIGQWERLGSEWKRVVCHTLDVSPRHVEVVWTWFVHSLHARDVTLQVSIPTDSYLSFQSKEKQCQTLQKALINELSVNTWLPHRTSIGVCITPHYGSTEKFYTINNEASVA